MLSVIVPIYNVEEYLLTCLNSLTTQTFSDVEFILIDDGSTDKSGILADGYASDPRFHVYHTDNRGLSAARNYGIEKANGEWLMFVDSDDWVSPNFCRYPFEIASRYNADLVIFQSYRVNRQRKHKTRAHTPTGIISAEIATKYGDTYVWNKLYKKASFDNISFPEGKVYEDIAVTYKIVFSAKTIVMMPDYLYYYRYRKDSISQIHKAVNKRDGFIAALQRYEDLNTYGYLYSEYDYLLYSYALAVLASEKPGDDLVYQMATQICDAANKLPKELSLKKKIMMLIWKSNRNLFYFICRSFQLQEG